MLNNNPLFNLVAQQELEDGSINPLQRYAQERKEAQERLKLDRRSSLGDALISAGSAMVTGPQFIPQGAYAPLSKGLQAGYNAYNQGLDTAEDRYNRAMQEIAMKPFKEERLKGMQLDNQIKETQISNYGQVSPIDQARIANLEANTAKTLNNMQNPRTMTKQDEMDYKAKKDRENKRYDQDIKILEGYTEKSEQADEYLSKTDIFKKAQAKLSPRGMGKGVFLVLGQLIYLKAILQRIGRRLEQQE